jgi:hypothetical protein
MAVVLRQLACSHPETAIIGHLGVRLKLGTSAAQYMCGGVLGGKFEIRNPKLSGVLGGSSEHHETVDLRQHLRVSPLGDEVFEADPGDLLFASVQAVGAEADVADP